jgi:hypothetical protein
MHFVTFMYEKCHSVSVVTLLGLFEHDSNKSSIRTYTKVVPFREKSSFHFVVLWQTLNGME